jgi:hypothetical protein
MQQRNEAKNCFFIGNLKIQGKRDFKQCHELKPAAHFVMVYVSKFVNETGNRRKTPVSIGFYRVFGSVKGTADSVPMSEHECA